MHILKYKFIACLTILMVFSAASFSQDKKVSTAIKEKYENIKVVKFDIKPGVKFPESSLDVMMAEIVDELKKLNTFKQVLMEAELERKSSQSGEEIKVETSKNENKIINETSEATIRLIGEITEYKPGSRTARYLIGFGAGMTKVKAHIKFVDATTGRVVFEKDVDGKVIIGIFGGDSNNATRGFAREVAEIVKGKLF